MKKFRTIFTQLNNHPVLWETLGCILAICVAATEVAIAVAIAVAIS